MELIQILVMYNEKKNEIIIKSKMKSNRETESHKRKIKSIPFELNYDCSRERKIRLIVT